MIDAIIKKIQNMAGKYSVYAIFDDWVSMMALAMNQQVNYSKKQEQEYLTIAEKHDSKDMSELMGMLTMAADEKMMDILGYIYMHLELGSSRAGQFFTPYHICKMVAAMGYKETEKDIYVVNEPSCGGGGNIIAFAELLKNKGINYQEKMVAVCQDIDLKAVYMTYVQCMLYGIPAVVFQTDTLRDPISKGSKRFYTMTYVMKYDLFSKYAK